VEFQRTIKEGKSTQEGGRKGRRGGVGGKWGCRGREK